VETTGRRASGLRKREREKSVPEITLTKPTSHRARFTAFAIIGASLFWFGIGLQVLLTGGWHLNAITSFLIQGVVSVQLSYLLNRYWTWRCTRPVLGSMAQVQQPEGRSQRAQPRAVHGLAAAGRQLPDRQLRHDPQPWCAVTRAGICGSTAAYAITYASYLQPTVPADDPAFRAMMTHATRMATFQGFKETITIWRLRAPTPPILQRVAREGPRSLLRASAQTGCSAYGVVHRCPLLGVIN
jgi:hypothetical protein